jgi:hypothetical protein
LKPSWLKIKAVEKHLLPSSSSASSFDWVFWMDADALIMNPNIRLEDIILSSISSPFPSTSSSVDLLLTRDHRSINAGVWFLRRSSWSLEFLSSWWSLRLQENFVRKWRSKTPGDTIGRSGDQDALHYLLKVLSKSEPTFSPSSFFPSVVGKETEVGQEGQEWEEHWKEEKGETEGVGSEHVRVVRQCLFNSYFEWKSFDGVFMNGDFVCHFAGLFHHRSELIHSFLKEHNIYAGAQWV